jgi:hypothetical protein
VEVRVVGRRLRAIEQTQAGVQEPIGLACERLRQDRVMLCVARQLLRERDQFLRLRGRPLMMCGHDAHMMARSFAIGQPLPLSRRTTPHAACFSAD